LFPHYTSIPQRALFCTQKVSLHQSKIFWFSDPFEVEIARENSIVLCVLCFPELVVLTLFFITLHADQFGAEVTHGVCECLLVAPLTVTFPLNHFDSTA
jgi:hypothetical protein